MGSLRGAQDPRAQPSVVNCWLWAEWCSWFLGEWDSSPGCSQFLPFHCCLHLVVFPALTVSEARSEPWQLQETNLRSLWMTQSLVFRNSIKLIETQDNKSPPIVFLLLSNFSSVCQNLLYMLGFWMSGARVFVNVTYSLWTAPCVIVELLHLYREF